MAQRLNHIPGGKMLVFTDHITYEVRMLRVTYELLEAPAFSMWVRNSLIESFCVHARNLLEFLEEDSSESNEQVCSRHFTEKAYRPFINGNLDGHLRGKLHAQIAHLSYNRAWDDDAKITAEDRKTLLELLNREIEHFAAHLQLPYKEKWPADLQDGTVEHFNLKNESSVTGFIADMNQVTMTPDRQLGGLDGKLFKRDK